jgi:phosphoglycolate phosphatase
MPRLQGLIFDLDGTLIDSAPDLRHALNTTMTSLGRRELSLDEVQSMIGDGGFSLLARAFAATGAPVSDKETYGHFQTFLAHYRGLTPDQSQIYPLGREVLETFSRANVTLGICTNKQEAATRYLLAGLDLARYFGFVAGGDTFPVHKPHPDHVRGVIEGLSVPLENCVMVGDGPNDVLAAQSAGIPCIVVTHGYGGFDNFGGDHVIEGFHELADALRTLGYEFD